MNTKHSSRNYSNTSPAHTPKAELANKKLHLRNYVQSLLDDLRNVEQTSQYHPEGNALFHSLQVYQCATNDTDDPELLAAALLHDVGKSIDYPNHDQVGADLLVGLLSPRIVWLIRHHLDLLVSPRKTRKRLTGTKQLRELESLRNWDLSGRDPNATVISTQEAVDHVFIHFEIISRQGPDLCYID